MTLTLRVQVAPWWAHIRRTAEEHGDVIAVVKGNGYGFGIARLADTARDLGLDALAVGTVHEVASLPAHVAAPIVLTPSLNGPPPGRSDVVLTVASVAHVNAVPDDAAVIVKLASAMQRYGVTADGLGELLGAVDRRGLERRGFALHLPLDADVAEVDAWLRRLPAGETVSMSHLSSATLDAVRSRHPQRRLPVRLGTALWHGDKSFLALRAEVVDVRSIRAGDVAGYRGVPVPGDGALVMVGAGTAHGVHPLPDGRSPFHFARRRLALLEPPHMHTSMVWVARGDPAPDIGAEVDVQQPLTWVWPDRVAED